MKTYIILLFIIPCSISLKSQDTANWKDNIFKNKDIFMTPKKLFKTMDFVYIPVDGLYLTGKLHALWEPYSGTGCPVIQSDDRQFLSAIEIQFFSKTIAKEMRNTYHFRKIREHFEEIVEKKLNNSYEDFRENVDYCSVEYARETFNADTVICYNLPVKNVKSYVFNENKVKYDICEVLALIKNDLGPVFFYCFYTNEGYKNRKEYMEKLEKSVRFKD